MSTDIDPCEGTLGLENKKFAVDCNGKVTVRVQDDCNAIILTDILAALGGTSSSAKTQKIFNETIAVANTEQSLVLPTTVCGYMIKTRGNGSLKFTHVSGESGTAYLEVSGKSAYTDEHVYNNLTLYFQSPQLGEVVEIITWE